MNNVEVMIVAAGVAFVLFAYIIPALIVVFEKDRRRQPDTDRTSLFNIKSRDRTIFTALFVTQTLLLTYIWSEPVTLASMTFAENLERVSGKATLAAPVAALSTFILAEGVYGIMIMLSYVYDQVKKERAEFHKQKGRAEGRAEGKVEGRAEGRVEGRAEGKAEGRAEGIEQGRAQRDAEVAALKARIAELERSRNGSEG